MAVTPSAHSTSQTTISPFTSPGTDAKITVGATDTVLVSTVIFGGSASATGLSAHWDSTGTNQAMTQLVLEQDSGGHVGVAIFGLVNPTPGAKTFSFSATNITEVHFYHFSFTGSDTTGGATTFPHTAVNLGTTGTSLSAALTSATGHYTVGGTVSDQTISSFSGTSPNGYTQNVGPNVASAAGEVTGAATVTYSATYVAGNNIAIAAVDIASPAAAANFNFDPFFERSPLKLATPRETAFGFMQGPFAGNSPALSSPYVQAPLFEPIRLKPTTPFEWSPLGTNPPLSTTFATSEFFPPNKLKPTTQFDWNAPGTSPQLSAPWVQAPFFDPTKLVRTTPFEWNPPGTSPHIATFLYTSAFFEVTKLGRTTPFDWTPFVPPVATPGYWPGEFFLAVKLKPPLDPFAWNPPGTSPALNSPRSFDPWFDAVRLKQPIVQNPDIVPPFPVVIVGFSLSNWFDVAAKLKIPPPLLEAIPPFTLEAPPPTTAFFERTQLLRPRLWDMDLPPAFTLEAPPPTAPFFDPLRKLQVPAGLDWTKATTQSVTIVQGVLVDWFERVKLKLPVVDTPLVVYFPAQVLPTFPTVHNLPIIVTTGKLKSF